MRTLMVSRTWASRCQEYHDWRLYTIGRLASSLSLSSRPGKLRVATVDGNGSIKSMIQVSSGACHAHGKTSIPYQRPSGASGYPLSETPA